MVLISSKIADICVICLAKFLWNSRLKLENSILFKNQIDYLGTFLINIRSINLLNRTNSGLNLTSKNFVIFKPVN